MAEEQLSVLIIGAGAKGAFSDVSHAKAFSKPPFRLVGFVDSDYQKAVDASWRFHNTLAWPNIYSALAQAGPIDVAVVAVPDAAHEAVLKELVGKRVRLIFAEKPFTRSAETARELLYGFMEHGQTVSVNYTRRFSPMFQEVQGLIRDGDLGDFLGGSGFYGKGLYHNGSHMIDLLRMLVGEVKPHFPLLPIVDSNPDDPSRLGMIDVGGLPFYLGVLPRPAINAFEATLYFTAGAVRITDVGRQIEVCRTKPRADYPQEMVYESDYETWDTREPMKVAAQNIADHLLHGVPLLSPAENAIKVLEVCEALL